MKKLLLEILKNLRPFCGTGCKCSACEAAREITPKIQAELDKFGANEKIDLELLFEKYRHLPGNPQSREDERITATLSKVIKSLYENN